MDLSTGTENTPCNTTICGLAVHVAFAASADVSLLETVRNMLLTDYKEKEE